MTLYVGKKWGTSAGDEVMGSGQWWLDSQHRACHKIHSFHKQPHQAVLMCYWWHKHEVGGFLSLVQQYENPTCLSGIRTPYRHWFPVLHSNKSGLTCLFSVCLARPAEDGWKCIYHLCLSEVTFFHCAAFSEKTGIPTRLKETAKMDGLVFCENCYSYGTIEEFVPEGKFCSQKCAQQVKNK